MLLNKTVSFNYECAIFQKSSDVENIVKKNLEIIVLSLIKTHPMRGQDIVKEIYKQHNIYISQNSVYSVLYSLKKQNILKISNIKKDMRSKIYIPTERGNEIIDETLAEFMNSLEYLLTVLKGP